MNEFMKYIRYRMAVFSVILSATIAFMSNIPTFAQRNLDVCRVTATTWSIEEKRGTGIFEIGKFPINDFEGSAKNFLY